MTFTLHFLFSLNLRNSQMADLLIDAFLRQDLLSLQGLSGFHISNRRCYEDMKLQGYCNCSNLLAKFLAKWRPRTSFMINKCTYHHRALAPREPRRDSPDVMCSFRSHFFPQNEGATIHHRGASSSLVAVNLFKREYYRRHYHGEKRRGGRGRKGEHNFIWLDDNQ